MLLVLLASAMSNHVGFLLRLRGRGGARGSKTEPLARTIVSGESCHSMTVRLFCVIFVIVEFQGRCNTHTLTKKEIRLLSESTDASR